MGATAGLAPRDFELPSNILFWPHHCSFSLRCWFCFHDVADVLKMVKFFYHFPPMGPDHESYIWT